MTDVQQEFEDYFLSLPDVDETLLEDKTEDGKHYNVEAVEWIWFGFRAGYSRGEKG